MTNTPNNQISGISLHMSTSFCSMNMSLPFFFFKIPFVNSKIANQQVVSITLLLHVFHYQYSKWLYYVGSADDNFLIIRQPSWGLSQNQGSCKDAMGDGNEYRVGSDSASSNMGLNSVSLLFSFDVLVVASNTTGGHSIQHDCCCRHHVWTNNILYCSWQLQIVDHRLGRRMFHTACGKLLIRSIHSLFIF
jgi:hypothetical protein